MYILRNRMRRSGPQRTWPGLVREGIKRRISGSKVEDEQLLHEYGGISKMIISPRRRAYSNQSSFIRSSTSKIEENPILTFGYEDRRTLPIFDIRF